MKKKPGADAWRRELKDARTAPAGAAAAEGKKVALGTYLPEEEFYALKSLAVWLSRERGKRVTVTDLVTEAVRALLAQYHGPEPLAGKRPRKK